jgi:hypothetical protein
MMSKLKQTYLKQDSILKQQNLNGNYSAILTNRDHSVGTDSRPNFSVIPLNIDGKSPRISTDLPINRMHGVSLSPLSKN